MGSIGADKTGWPGIATGVTGEFVETGLL